MKTILLDFSEFAIYKSLLLMYVLLNGFSAWLLTLNQHVEFAYFGFAGQLVAQLIGIHNSLKPANAKVVISLRVVIKSLTEMIIGPSLAMFVMSYISEGNITPFTGLGAFLIGAFWEIIWIYLKKYVQKKGEDAIDDDIDITKTTADGGEPVKGGGQ